MVGVLEWMLEWVGRLKMEWVLEKAGSVRVLHGTLDVKLYSSLCDEAPIEWETGDAGLQCLQDCTQCFKLAQERHPG